MTLPSIRGGALFGSRALDPLTLVDENGKETGTATLEDMHLPPGKRHRAFSVYLFDEAGRLFVHQRAQAKAFWGTYWTNSCCSHPYHGEPVGEAAKRRVGQELGFENAELTELFAYEYRAEFKSLGVEHEYVHVFVGTVDPASITVDPLEVEEFRWLLPDEVDALIASNENTTPWFEIAWPQVRDRAP